MREADSGAVRTVTGEYTEIRRPEPLAYSWSCEDSSEQMRGSQQTLVVVDFLEDGDATTVVLTHRGFADPQIRDLHADGWQGCLDSLVRRILDGVQNTARQ
jgi:uncharacterized protein YndB with AHSA1/START domain